MTAPSGKMRPELSLKGQELGIRGGTKPLAWRAIRAKAQRAEGVQYLEADSLDWRSGGEKRLERWAGLRL